ncbi:hypothetical protein ChUKH1_09220 [Cryptosporidium hominis]|nr:hypothetical protein ChTU502y2012_389g0070 [Cryptosporidium hominis]PPA63713.1 hypothetical protein ChUKH1_09220 [Cryptosporidium hominis]
MKISIPKGDNYILAVSSLPQSQRELILKLSSDDVTNYDSYLDSFQRWIWDKGDLQCWASVLNRFDDYINSYIIREELGNPFLLQHLTLNDESTELSHSDENILKQANGYIRDVSEEMMKKILKSTFLILENCTSKSLYASTIGLIALLDSSNPDIVCWSLRTLTTTCSNWKKPKRYIDSETVYHLQMRLSTLCYLPIHTRSSNKSGIENKENEALSSLTSFYKEETWVNPNDDDLIEVYIPPFICNHFIKKDSDSEEKECKMCFDYHKSHILMIQFKDLISVNSKPEVDDLMRKYKVPICLKSIVNHYIRILKSYGDKWLRRKWVDVKYTTLLSFPGFSTNNLVNICQVNTTLIPDSIEILEFCHLSIFEGNSKVKLNNNNEQYRFITSMRSIVELLTLMLQDRIFPKVIVQALNFTNSYGLISRIIWDILYYINDHKDKPLPKFIKKPPESLNQYKYNDQNLSNNLLDFEGDHSQFNILEYIDPSIFKNVNYPLPDQVIQRLSEIQINYDKIEENNGNEDGENCYYKGNKLDNQTTVELHKKYNTSLSSYMDLESAKDEILLINNYYENLDLEFQKKTINDSSKIIPNLIMAEFEEEMINFVMELIGIYILVMQLYPPPNSIVTNSSSSSTSYIYIPHHITILIAFIDFISTIRHPYYIILVLPICRALETLLEKKTYISFLLQQNKPIYKIMLSRLQYEIGLLQSEKYYFDSPKEEYKNKIIKDEGVILIRQWIIKTSLKFMELFIHPNNNSLVSNSDSNPIISQSKIQYELLMSEDSIYRSCLMLILMYPETYSLLNYSLVIQLLIPLVSNDPTIVPDLINNHLIPFILYSINFGILQNDDILNILAVNLPIFFLHNDGIKLMKSINFKPLILLSQFLTSSHAIHIDRMGEIATLVGNAFEEIVRYHSQLAKTISLISVSAILQIRFIQKCLPKWEPNPEISKESLDSPEEYYTPIKIPKKSKDLLISDRMAIVGRFLCGYLSNHDTINQFILQGGPYHVLRSIVDDSLPPAFAAILTNHPLISLFTFLGTSRNISIADLQYQVLPTLQEACKDFNNVEVDHNSISRLSKVVTCIFAINCMFRNAANYNHSRIVQSYLISKDIVKLQDSTSPCDYCPYGASIMSLYNQAVNMIAPIFPKLLEFLYFNASEKYLQDSLLSDNNMSASLLNPSFQSHAHPLLIKKDNSSNNQPTNIQNNSSGINNAQESPTCSTSYPVLSVWPQLSVNDFLWSTQIKYAYSNVVYYKQNSENLSEISKNTDLMPIIMELCRISCCNIRSCLILASRLTNTFKKKNNASLLFRNDNGNPNNLTELSPLQYFTAFQIVAIFNQLFKSIPELSTPFENIDNTGIAHADHIMHEFPAFACNEYKKHEMGQICCYIAEIIDVFYRVCIDDKQNNTFYIFLIDLSYKTGIFEKIMSLFHFSMSTYWMVLGKIIGKHNTENVNKMLPPLNPSSRLKYSSEFLGQLSEYILPKLSSVHNLNGLLYLATKSMHNNILLLEHFSSWKRYLNSTLTTHLHKSKFHLNNCRPIISNTNSAELNIFDSSLDSFFRMEFNSVELTESILLMIITNIQLWWKEVLTNYYLDMAHNNWLIFYPIRCLSSTFKIMLHIFDIQSDSFNSFVAKNFDQSNDKTVKQNSISDADARSSSSTSNDNLQLSSNLNIDSSVQNHDASLTSQDENTVNSILERLNMMGFDSRVSEHAIFCFGNNIEVIVEYLTGVTERNENKTMISEEAGNYMYSFRRIGKVLSEQFELGKLITYKTLSKEDKKSEILRIYSTLPSELYYLSKNVYYSSPIVCDIMLKFSPLLKKINMLEKVLFHIYTSMKMLLERNQSVFSAESSNHRYQFIKEELSFLQDERLNNDKFPIIFNSFYTSLNNSTPLIDSNSNFNKLNYQEIYSNLDTYSKKCAPTKKIHLSLIPDLSLLSILLYKKTDLKSFWISIDSNYIKLTSTQNKNSSKSKNKSNISNSNTEQVPEQSFHPINSLLSFVNIFTQGHYIFDSKHDGFTFKNMERYIRDNLGEGNGQSTGQNNQNGNNINSNSNSNNMKSSQRPSSLVWIPANKETESKEYNDKGIKLASRCPIWFEYFCLILWRLLPIFEQSIPVSESSNTPFLVSQKNQKDIIFTMLDILTHFPGINGSTSMAVLGLYSILYDRDA